MKEKNYAVKPGRAKCHQVRFTTIGISITEYFYTEEEALLFRNAAGAVIKKMKAALNFMDATNYKGRLSQSDTLVLDDALIDWEAAGLTPLRNKVIWLNSELRGSDEYVSNLNPLVSHMISAYLDNRKNDKDKKTVDKGSMARYRFWHSESKLSKMPCRSVTPTLIKSELTKLRDHRGVAPGTVNRYLVALQGAWTLMLKREGMTMENMPRKVTKLKEEYLNTPAYTSEECEIIFAALRIEDEKHSVLNENRTDNGSPGFADLEALCRVASVTGIRRTFLAELKVDEILNLNNPKQANIHKQMKGNSKKRVPLVSSAIAILKEQIKHAENGYVFHSNGVPPGSATFTRFDKIVRSLDGVRYTPKPFHSFRAYVATTMFENGKTATQVAVMLGCSEKVAAGYISRSDKGDEEIKNGIEADNVSTFVPPRPKLSVVKG